MQGGLEAIETWAGALLSQLSEGERRKLTQTIARELRRRQQQRIAAQAGPDGAPFPPRKDRKGRGKQGRIKQRAMFSKLRQAKHLVATSDASSISVGFLGRTARIARVHQLGLRDRAEPGAPDVRYPRRQLLGFSSADLDLIRDHLLRHLS